MSDELKNLVQIAANVVVSAMAADGWEAAERRFADVVGLERQLESTHTNLVGKRGRSLTRATTEEERDWVNRLQVILDRDPGIAPALQGLIANPGAAPVPVPRSQSQNADHGSGIAGGNVTGDADRGSVIADGNIIGDTATGGSKIFKPKIRLYPFIFLGHVAKQAVKHPAVAAVTLVVGAGAVSGGLVIAKAKTPGKADPPPVASPAPTHTVVPIPLSDTSWPQLDGGPSRTGYQTGEARIGPGNVRKLALKRTYPTTANGGASAPLIANGILYVDTNRLYAFDATGATGCADTPTTCTPLWTAVTPFFHGMTVADGDVFVTDQNGVQAFDAAGTTNCSGTPKVCGSLWTTGAGTNTTIGGFTPGTGSPVAADGVLYVTGSENGTPSSQGGTSVAAFSAAGSAGCSGTPAVCVPLRTYGGPGSDADGIPTIANGVLYIVNGVTLYAFDATGSSGCSGTPRACVPLWTAAMPSSSYPVVAAADGMVYVSTAGSGLYAFDAAGTANCSVRTTAKTCAPLWNAPTPGAGPLAVANGVAYIAAGGAVYAFDATAPENCPGTGTTKTCSRAPLWASAASAYPPDGPSLIVADGIVYITSANGGVDAYSAAGSRNCSVTGTAKTCTPLSDSTTGITTGGSPAIVDGVLFVNAPVSGDVYALSP